MTNRYLKYYDSINLKESLLMIVREDHWLPDRIVSSEAFIRTLTMAKNIIIKPTCYDDLVNETDAMNNDLKIVLNQIQQENPDITAVWKFEDTRVLLFDALWEIFVDELINKANNQKEKEWQTKTKPWDLPPLVFKIIRKTRPYKKKTKKAFWTLPSFRFALEHSLTVYPNTNDDFMKDLFYKAELIGRKKLCTYSSYKEIKKSLSKLKKILREQSTRTYGQTKMCAQSYTTKIVERTRKACISVFYFIVHPENPKNKQLYR